MTVRIGAKLPDFGALTKETSLVACARRAESAGFDSVWASDHIVMPRSSASTYPFGRDGRMTWDPTEPWFDSIVSMATAAAVTEHVEVGVAVLVAALRHPIVLAKQIATIDVLSRGRVSLGVGAGWLKEEYDALGAPFDRRGSRLDEWIDLMRDCWTGTPAGMDGEHYRLPDGVICEPQPAHHVPILIGGSSTAAFSRVTGRGDGWLGFTTADAVDVQLVRRARRAIEEGGDGMTSGRSRIVMRIPGDASGVALAIRDLRDAGVDDVIVNVPWRVDDGPEHTINMLRSALG